MILVSDFFWDSAESSIYKLDTLQAYAVFTEQVYLLRID